MKIDLISVVPSPYQREFFRALANEPGCTLRVHYLEDAAPDSPWPSRALAPYERVLPGWTAGRGRVRCHTNWALPDFNDCDIAIVNASLTAITTQQVMQRLSKRSIPWVFWGEVLRKRSGITGKLQQVLAARLRRASAIVAIGSVAMDDYRSRFPSTPLYQLPYYCELDAFTAAARNPAKATNNEPAFLFCGQMIARKGIDVLLEAFESSYRRGLRAKLVLAGREADLPPLLAKVSPDVRKSIDYVGFQAPEQLPELFANASAFVLPSRHDGWGVVVNQAIGAGLPVIATDAAGAARDLIENEVNGMVVPAGDVESLSNALLKIGSDSTLQHSMSEASFQKALTLTPEFGAQKFHDILADVTSDKMALLA